MTPIAELKVRRAGPDDEPAIEGCVHDAYESFVEAIGTRPAPMLDDYERLIADGRVWVAALADQLFGVIVMWGEPDHWYVDNIAVDPVHQGKGVGTALLVEADRHARRAGLGTIRLYTNEAMTANQDFYPRRGFTETRRALDRGYRRIFYERRLPTSDPEGFTSSREL